MSIVSQWDDVGGEARRDQVRDLKAEIRRLEDLIMAWVDQPVAGDYDGRPVSALRCEGFRILDARRDEAGE